MQSNWIGNRPVPGGGGEIAILNPATEELIDSIPRGCQDDADAAVMATTLSPGQTLVQTLAPGRVAYLVPARGSVTVNGAKLNPRDGAAIRDVAEIHIIAEDEAELVMVEAAG